MKNLNLLALIFLCSCSNSNSSDNNLAQLNELNGTWLSTCTGTTSDFSKQEISYNNGSYSSTTTQYSDTNCTTATGVTVVESGTYTYIKDITTESGLTAKAINKQVILPADFQPKSIDSFVYVDNDTLYFGASSGDFEVNVIFFDQPHSKVN